MQKSEFNPKWTVSQELLLFEGLLMFGFGNWKLIAKHLGTKTDKQCEEFYITKISEGSELDSEISKKTNSIVE